MENDKKNHTASIIIAITVICCVFVILSFNKNIVHNILSKLNLIPLPEQLTELYFENPSLLPRQTVADKPILFLFTIHNLEGKETSYPYEVYFEYPDGEKISFASSTITLNDDASTTIPVTHTFRSSNVVGKVVVELPTIDQNIDFLLHDNNI